MIHGPDQVVEPDHLTLNPRDFFGGKPLHRTLGAALLLGHPDHDVPATRIVKIVGKGADGAVNRIRIPPFFELDAIRLHRSGSQ